MAVNRYYSSTAVDTTLATSTTASDTKIVVSSTQGFPTSYPYTLALDYDTSAEELVNIVGASGTTLTIGTDVGTASTVGRGVDSTTAQAHAVGAVVKHVISARDMTEAQTHIAATANVHGISDTSNIATKTGIETLTNKTLTAPTVTNGTFTTPSITGSVGGNPTFTGIVVLPSTTTVGTVSATELAYVDGVTSAIQTQLDSKAPTASPTFTGTVTLPTGAVTNNMLAGSIAPAKITGTAIVANDYSYLNPVGMVAPFAGASSPNGWLICDGTAVSRSTYASLFSAIGTTYGVGDNTTTFNLPDLRGRTPIGVGTGTGLTARALAATVGAESVTLTAGQSGVPAHSHANTATATDSGHSHTVTWTETVDSTGDAPAGTFRLDTGNSSFQGTNSIGTSSNSANITVSVTNVNNTAIDATDAHTNMQPSIALNYIIKY